MTRAMVVTVLWRMEEKPAVEFTEDFTDVKAGKYYSDAVIWAKNNDIVNGVSEGKFDPGGKITREQLATMLYRYADFKALDTRVNGDLSKFPDADKTHSYAKAALTWATDQGLITGVKSGDKNLLDPRGNATREQFATILMRYADSGKDPMYARMADITDYVETDNQNIVIRLLCRERIVGSGTTFSLSNILLPQMGLSTDTYEMLIHPSNHSLLIYDTDCSFTGDELTNNRGEARSDNFGVCKLAVRNKKTGETTPYKVCRLLVCRSFGPVVMDPDGFEPGISPELYERMKEASLYTLGDTSRFARAFDKARRGEPVTAVYIGGSVTARASAGDDHCFAKLTQNWLQKTFPESEMTYINQGIASTSYFAVLRLGQCLMKYDPDFVFIEFGQNDTSAAKDREGYESMIRRILSDSDAAVMSVLTGIAGYNNCDYMKRISDKYGVPLCDVRTGADMALDAGEIYDVDLTYDGGHPREWGHNLIAAMMVHELRAIMASVEENGSGEVSRELPEDRITAAETEDLTYVTPSVLLDPVPSGWYVTESGKFDLQLRTTDPDAALLTFAADCRNLFILCYGSADFLVSVDGGEFAEASASKEYFKAVSSDVTAPHTVVIKPCAEFPVDEEDMTPTPVKICGFSYN